MGVPLLLEAISRPVTTLAVCGCTAVWFYIQASTSHSPQVSLFWDSRPAGLEIHKKLCVM